MANVSGNEIVKGLGTNISRKGEAQIFVKIEHGFKKFACNCGEKG